MLTQTLSTGMAWLLTMTLIMAAVIDGRSQKVPNWLTFPLVATGLAYGLWAGGASGLGWSLLGMIVGLAVLLPLYAIGGMGAGDVKLFAGVGAWVGPVMAVQAFVVSGIVGGVIAFGMMLWSGQWYVHWLRAREIAREIITVKNPDELARRAEKRKPSMMLLPYGIPLAIGSITWFAWSGLLG